MILINSLLGISMSPSSRLLRLGHSYAHIHIAQYECLIIPQWLNDEPINISYIHKPDRGSFIYPPPHIEWELPNRCYHRMCKLNVDIRILGQIKSIRFLGTIFDFSSFSQSFDKRFFAWSRCSQRSSWICLIELKREALGGSGKSFSFPLPIVLLENCQSREAYYASPGFSLQKKTHPLNLFLLC